jgi:hypothetical protein
MITIIFAAPAFAYLLILAYRWHERFPFLERKPFNCVVCLSAWIGISLFFLPDVVAQAVAAFSLSGIMGKVIYNNIN